MKKGPNQPTILSDLERGDEIGREGTRGELERDLAIKENGYDCKIKN